MAKAAITKPKNYKFTPELKGVLLQVMAETGSLQEACAVVGVGRGCVYLHRAEGSPQYDAQFAEAYTEAERAGLKKRLDVGEAKLYDRGVHGWKSDVFYQGSVCGDEQRFDTPAAIFALKSAARRLGDDRYVEKTENKDEHSGSIEIVAMTYEQREARIKELLERAGKANGSK